MAKPTDNTFNPGRIALGGTAQNPILYPPIPYFPIGYVYISVDPTNPAEYFGGTWQRLSKCFLYAADPATDNSTTDPFRAGQSGGSRSKKIEQNNLPNVSVGLEFTNIRSSKLTHNETNNNKAHGFLDYFAANGTVKPAMFQSDCTMKTAGTNQNKDEILSWKYKIQGDTDWRSEYCADVVTESINGGVNQADLEITPEYLSVYMWRRVS